MIFPSAEPIISRPLRISSGRRKVGGQRGVQERVSPTPLRSFAPDVVRDPLRQASRALFDGRTNKPGRTRRYTSRTSPHGIRTTQPRSLNTVC
jgi:hypothetical protein